MALRYSYKINDKVLMTQLTASEPVFRKAMDQVAQKAFFEPAVAALKRDFDEDKVTQEIKGGTSSTNITKTLRGKFAGAMNPNLWGFIGLEGDPEQALEAVEERLEPGHPEGPQMIYRKGAKTRLEFIYEVKAPSLSAIYNDKRTHFPWLKGISWVKRIEQGIPGITRFQNISVAASRSGGGIQMKNSLRKGGSQKGQARFVPRGYLSPMFNNFLRRVAARKPTGRSPLS